MIIIETKSHKFKYFGDISIYCNDIFLCVDWININSGPQDMDELNIWRDNGFDRFFLEEVISIRGEANDFR